MRISEHKENNGHLIKRETFGNGISIGIFLFCPVQQKTFTEHSDKLYQRSIIRDYHKDD